MVSSEFIETNLNELYTKFSGIKLRYEYRKNSSSHLIEVMPSSFFNENEMYNRIESNIEYEFEKLFPDEDIVFITEGSLTEIKNPNLKLGYE